MADPVVEALEALVASAPVERPRVTDGWTPAEPTLPAVVPSAPQPARSPWRVPFVLNRSHLDLIREAAVSAPRIVGVEPKPGPLVAPAMLLVDGSLSGSEVVAELESFSVKVRELYISDFAPKLVEIARQRRDYQRWAHNFSKEAVYASASKILDFSEEMYQAILNTSPMNEDRFDTGPSFEQRTVDTAPIDPELDIAERQQKRETEAREDIEVAVAGIGKAIADVSAAQRRVIERVAFARKIGATWQDIGSGVGITPQAAHQRWEAKLRSLDSASDPR